MEKPDNYPDIIYKYRNWSDEFHKDVIRLNHLFFSSPIQFNDPFDCKIPDNFFLLNNSEKIEEYADSVINRHKDRIVQDGKNIEIERQKIKDRLKNIPCFQKEHESFTIGKQLEYLGVISLSNRWDSILMWSHYADYHKGYCVGFYERKFRENEIFGKGGPVNYSADFPQLDPIVLYSPEKSFKQTHSKALEWSYEQEYRLTRTFFPKIPTDLDRTIKIQDDFFAEIIIGLNAKEETKEEIKKICILKGIKLFQITKIPFRFELSREIIE